VTTSHNVPACSCAAGSVVVVDIVSVCTGITTRTTSHGCYLLHASYRFMCIPPTPPTHTLIYPPTHTHPPHTHTHSPYRALQRKCAGCVGAIGSSCVSGAKEARRGSGTRLGTSNVPCAMKMLSRNVRNVPYDFIITAPFQLTSHCITYHLYINQLSITHHSCTYRTNTVTLTSDIQ